MRLIHSQLEEPKKKISKKAERQILVDQLKRQWIDDNHERVRIQKSK
jgi:hypothetical protein